MASALKKLILVLIVFLTVTVVYHLARGPLHLMLALAYYVIMAGVIWWAANFVLKYIKTINQR